MGEYQLSLRCKPTALAAALFSSFLVGDGAGPGGVMNVGGNKGK